MGAPPTVAPAGLGSRPRPGRRAVVPAGALARWVGEILITAGLVVALFIVYLLWITDIVQSRTQYRLRVQLGQTWQHPPAAGRRPGTPSARPAPPVRPSVGQAFAVLRIPRFGPDYAPVIVEGVSTAELRRGPGHYPGTAMPGQLGNFVVSGHRTTYGKPFSRIDELKVGDPVVVEVRDFYYVYRVSGSEVVDPDRLDVTDPVPERPGEKPSHATLTLTTCHPKFSASRRLIVFAVLATTRPKPGGVPAGPGGN
jgi:sortase A